MTCWRMQVHPGDSENAIRHIVESISAGDIRLDFVTPSAFAGMITEEEIQIVEGK